MMSKTTSESIESLLLTPKENKLVVHILGKGKKSLATAVAQVFLALPSDRTQWSKIGTGVVCFVKDKAEKSFFIRMLDIKEKCIVWEQEIYKQFKYRAVSKHFQTFFADDCRAGINFSSAEEAAIFRSAVMERVNVLKKKREEVRQRKMATYQQKQQMNYQMAMQNPYFRMPMPPAQMQSLLLMQMRSPAVAANQRAQLQAMFNSMTPETRQAFFTSLNGGPSVMAQPGNLPGMQWPGGNQSISSLPVSSSSQVVTATMPQPPLLDQPLTSESAIVETTSRDDFPDVPPEPPGSPTPGAPGPPPPPPPPPPTCTPPPPLLGSTSSVTKSSAGPPPTSDRSGLLESILAGTKLRKVDESSSRKKIPMVESGMRGALARALDNRAKVLGDEDSDDDVDEEWDDDDEDDWSD